MSNMRSAFASAFTEWLRRYEKNPAEFSNYGEAKSYGEASADYFIKILDTLADGKPWQTHRRVITGLTLATLSVVLVLVSIGRYGTLRGLVNAGEEPGVQVSAEHWLLVQASAAHRLLGMLILPIGQTVDADYDILPQPQSGLIGLLMLGTLSVTAWVVRRRYPLVTFGLLWMLIVIAPRLVIQTPRSYLAEHHVFMAIIGFAFIVGAMVSCLKRKS